MALNRTKSHGLGTLTIGDADSNNNVTGGTVGTDGRVDVQFHENPESLVEWFKQSSAPTPRPKPPRRFSSVAFQDQKLASTNPRLNIAIHIVGSRGDVQPFIPIAQLLSRPPYNHRVRICTHAAFKDFIESQGIEFFNIGGDPEALMAYMVKNPGLLPNRESVKAGDIGKRRKEMWDIIHGAWRSCIEAGDGMGERITAANVPSAGDLFIADAIIANPPSMAHIHCAEKLAIPLHMVFTMPWSPTETFSHPLAAMNYDNADAAFANYFSFMLMELLTWQGLGDLINKLRTQILRLDPISPMWGYQLLPRLRVPYSYLWSQSLIPKPPDWESHINITGFSFLPLAHSYTPPPDLEEFLRSGPEPIYVGFGSIVVDDPQALTKLIFDAVKLAGVRAIVSKGWGGVGAGDNVPDEVYLIGNCPHDWLFKHVSAVVHHGGAGTTAAGIAAGRPTVVVPFFGDQPFWGQMIARVGAGPTPVPFKEMTAETLAASIKFALKPEVTAAVQEIADQISDEDGAGGTVVDFNDRLALSDMACDICPDKLAVWLHKKSGAHLSPYAATCLVYHEIIDPKELKFLQHKRWYVDEGAEHPVIGAVAAASGFVTTLGTAGSEFSSRIRNRPRRSKKAKKEEKAAAAQAAAEVTEKKATAEATVPEVTLTQPNSDEDLATLAANTDPELEVTPANRDVDQETIAVQVEQSPPPRTNTILKEVLSPDITPTEMEKFARQMAYKSLRPDDFASKVHDHHEKRKKRWKAQEEGRYGEAFYLARATGRFTSDVAKAGLKAPVAFFYNVANGFHNFPSYTMASSEVRQRDQITGLGTGLRTAGKEFVMGFYDAFSGVVTKPYKGAKDEGLKGFGKGVWAGWIGFFFNIGASVFSLPGYTMKGIEKELSKHRLTKLKAEMILIRLRRGIDEFRRATPEERQEVADRWKAARAEQ